MNHCLEVQCPNCGNSFCVRCYSFVCPFCNTIYECNGTEESENFPMVGETENSERRRYTLKSMQQND